jgi:hypothetical protein
MVDEQPQNFQKVEGVTPQGTPGSITDQTEPITDFKSMPAPKQPDITTTITSEVGPVLDQLVKSGNDSTLQRQTENIKPLNTVQAEIAKNDSTAVNRAGGDMPLRDNTERLPSIVGPLSRLLQPDGARPAEFLRDELKAEKPSLGPTQLMEYIEAMVKAQLLTKEAIFSMTKDLVKETYGGSSAHTKRVEDSSQETK